MSQYICIDIGGTAIKYGRISPQGEILEQKERATEGHLGGPVIVAKVRDILDAYLAHDAKDYLGICISTAGMVDTEEGSIFHAGPTIPNYQGTQWKRILEEAYGLPVEVENDVNCAGLSEGMVGAARDCQSALILTIGTGIGGAFFLRNARGEGMIYHGFSQSACEVGYMDLGEKERYEALASTSALCQWVASKKGEELSNWDGRRIFEAAKAGDVICQDAIDRMVDYLCRGIANMVYVLNPECVVLGGGIMKQKDYLLPRLRQALDRHLIDTLAERTKLALAENGNQAGMLGAFYHFQSRHRSGGME